MNNMIEDSVDRRAYSFTVGRACGLLVEILEVEDHASDYWEVHYRTVTYVDGELVQENIDRFGSIGSVRVDKEGPFPKSQNVVVMEIADHVHFEFRREGKTFPPDAPDLTSIPPMPWEGLFELNTCFELNT